jgi:hypothetical protein
MTREISGGAGPDHQIFSGGLPSRTGELLLPGRSPERRRQHRTDFAGQTSPGVEQVSTALSFRQGGARPVTRAEASVSPSSRQP